MDPSTQSLELVVLFLGAATLAVAGVLAISLIPRIPPTLSREVRRRRLGDAAREWSLPSGLLAAGSLLVAAGLVHLLPPRIGSEGSVDLAMVAGAAGSAAAAALAIATTRLVPSAELPLEIDPDGGGRAHRRGWIAASAIVAGSGGIAVLTLIGLYLALAGSVPAMLGAPVGAAIGALAFRARAIDGGTAIVSDPEESRRAAWIRATLPASVPVAVDLFLAIIFASIGASLFAFVPSVVRTLEPNAVLFPLAAIAAVLLAGLGSVAIVALDLPASPARRRIAALGAALFGSIALLAVVPPYLPAGLGYFVCGVIGLLAAAGTVVCLSPSPAVAPGWMRLVRGTLPIAMAAVLSVIAFRVADGGTLAAGIASGPGLGGYGIAVLSVAFAGLLAGLSTLELGPRLSEAAPGDPNPSQGERPFHGGLESARLAALWLSGLVLMIGVAFLAPLEAGQPFSALVAATTIGAPGLWLGGLVGLVVPMAASISADREAPTQAPAPIPSGSGLAVGRTLFLIAVALGAPISIGWALGAAGLFGLVLGALLGTIGVGLSHQISGSPGSAADGPSSLPPAVTLTIVTVAVFASALFATSISGIL